MDPTVSNKPLHSYRFGDDSSRQKSRSPGKVKLPSLPEEVDFSRNTFRMSIFERYGALKLANIDAVVKFVGHIRSFLNPQVIDDEDYPYFFLDLCSGKGGFSEYIIYRRGFSKGGGITLNNENDFEGDNNYTMCRGALGDGDILADADEVVKFYTDRFTRFNVALGDGIIYEHPIGFKYFGARYKVKEEVSGPNNDNAVESYTINPLKYTQFELLYAEAYVSMKLLHSGGTLILRLSNPMDWDEGQLVFDMSRYFEEISLLRPITAEKGEVYFIGKNYTPFDGSLDTKSLTPAFIDWFVEGARQAAELLPVPSHQVDKCFVRWGIPSGSFKLPKKDANQKIAIGGFREWVKRKAGLDDLFERKSKGDWPHDLDEATVEVKNHLYNITTLRGTNVTLVKSRVDQYLKLIDDPSSSSTSKWSYLSDVIDWYAPFGFVGFRVLDGPSYTDLLCNPFTRGSKKWVSLYGELGSEGAIDDVFSAKYTFQVYIPPSRAALDLIHNLSTKNPSVKIRVYAPFWSNHPLIDHLRNKEIVKPDQINLWNFSTGERYIPTIPYVRGYI